MKVSFIDYGNTEQVSVNNIRPLSAEIAHIPVQAIPCVLFGIKVTDATVSVVIVCIYFPPFVFLFFFHFNYYSQIKLTVSMLGSLTIVVTSNVYIF